MGSRQFENAFVNDISLVWQHSFAAASIFVNCSLLFVLVTFKNRAIGSYRLLLMVFCTFDIYFTIVHWLVYPIPEMYKNTVLVRGHGIVRSRLGPSIYIAAYQATLPILAFHFIYRKLAITSPHYLKPPRQFFALMALSVFITYFVCLFINYCILAPDDINVRELAPLFEGAVASPLFHFNETAQDCMIAQYWEVETYSKPRWGSFVGVLTVASFSPVAYAIILHCGFIVNSFLKSKAASSRTLKLHRQLFISLVCQAVYPMIFNYFPIYVCVVLPIFGISQSWASIPIPLCCAAHPLLDPIFVIICNTDFRTAFLRFFAVCGNNSGTISSITNKRISLNNRITQ